MNFEQIFKQISPEEISDNVFKLVGRDYFLITAGKAEKYNAMVGSGGGWGTIFRRPATWCLLRGDRYTLEIIKKVQTYTLSYFPDEHREHMLFFGGKSGRDIDKMMESPLTAIQMLSGDMTFEEAHLVLECKLTQLTTGRPEDFFAQEDRDAINEAYKEANVYREYMFGEITHVWVKK